MNNSPKVENMQSIRGNDIPNQFIMSHTMSNGDYVRIFQSYDSIIVKTVQKGNLMAGGTTTVYLDEKYWNYSRTTSKYRTLFLGYDTKEVKAKIKSGEYVLTDLN